MMHIYIGVYVVAIKLMYVENSLYLFIYLFIYIYICMCIDDGFCAYMFSDAIKKNKFV